MDPIEMYPFGDLLRGFRNRAGMSRQALAKELGVHPNTLANWEIGNVLPKKQKIEHLAAILHLSEQEKSILLAAGLEPDVPFEHSHQFLPPSTHPKSILQRASIVDDIYAMLVQPGITAIVLTGIAGVGKSTLAALVYNYAELQRVAQTGPFTAQALWFRGDLSMTMTDFTRMLLTGLGKTATVLDNLSPHQQAITLFNAIKTASQPRLIVIDQFEDLLVRKTGATQADDTGFQEWLDSINGEECACRVLLTSRRWSQERRSICLQEYVVGSLQTAEGVELLQREGVRESERELREAVEHCGGHPMALVLLASLMRLHKLTLHDVWQQSAYTRLWQEDIARRLLDAVYKRQLDDMEQQLLAAFSIYREPVVIDAVFPLLDLDKNDHAQVYGALNTLLTQHLLQTSGGGHYRLHAIVADYALDHLRAQDSQALYTAHLRAASFYRQLAKHVPTADDRKQLRDVHPLIQVVWHLCQAEEWQGAYAFMTQENLHTDLRRLGGITVLLELYSLMLPLEKWPQDAANAQHIYFYLGGVYQDLGQLEHAKKAYSQFLRCSPQDGNKKEQAEAITYLGVAYDDSGQKEQARDYYEQALQLYREIGDRKGIGQALMMLGWVYTSLWDHEQAKRYCEQALNIFIALDDRGGQSWTLGKLGAIYDNAGHKEQAKVYREQCLNIMREVGDRSGEAWSLKHLGQLYHDLGQSQRAMDALQQALTFFTSVDNARGEAWVLNSMGKVYHDIDQKERARSALEQALDIFTQIEDLWGKGAVLNKLGRLYQSMEVIEQALFYYEQALSIRAGTRDLWGEAQTAENIGILYCEQRQHILALTFLERARALFERIKSPDLQRVQEQIDMMRKRMGDKGPSS